MSADEELNKKINIVETKLKENSNKVTTLFKDYQDFLSKEYSKYILKIKNKVDKRIQYLSNVKDENKNTIYKDTKDVLDNLLKKNEELVNNLSSSLESLKSYLSKEPNIFQNDEINNNDTSKKKKLVINSTDDCGKALILLKSEEGDKFEIYDINKITNDDFNYLFKDLIKKKEEKFTENLDEENDKNEKPGKNKIKKIKFKNSILNIINLSDYFPNIENLSISHCQLGYDINPKLKFNNLKILRLEGVELVSENFEDLLIFLLQDKTGTKGEDYIGKNLISLSVKCNRISRIIFPNDVDPNSKKNIKNDFVNLQFLDLSENNLFDYYTDKNKKKLFEDIKLLNISSNNFTSAPRIRSLIEEKGKDCLILASKNIGIMKNQKINDYYCNYLLEKLSKIDNNEYNIKSLVLEGLFKLKNKDLLIQIDLNKFKTSLVELNLSFNNINDEEIQLILDKNKDLINLKRLNLSSNEITEQFFAKFYENGFYKSYKNLKILNLSCNPIFFEKADIYKNFLSSCKNLESLILKNTGVGDEINNYLKNKIIMFTAKQKNKEFTTKDPKIGEMESLIDKQNKERFLKNNTKVFITISFVIKQKYIGFIKKYFPYLLDRIILE